MVALLFMLGTFGCGPSESEEKTPTNGEEEKEAEKVEEVEEDEEETVEEDEAKDEEEKDDEIEEDNPYDEAEEVAPMMDRNVVLDEDFSSVLEDVLEEKYDGDAGGNPYVSIYTTEEGENTQKIVITFL